MRVSRASCAFGARRDDVLVEAEQLGQPPGRPTDPTDPRPKEGARSHTHTSCSRLDDQDKIILIIKCCSMLRGIQCMCKFRRHGSGQQGSARSKQRVGRVFGVRFQMGHSGRTVHPRSGAQSAAGDTGESGPYGPLTAEDEGSINLGHPVAILAQAVSARVAPEAGDSRCRCGTCSFAAASPRRASVGG